MRHTYSKIAVLSALLLRAHAQLLSCIDLPHCPTTGFIGQCRVDDTEIPEVGVANFSSALSPKLLTWTIGYSPAIISNGTASRHFYLGTPQGLDLDNRTDITGCALFFNAFEPTLSFPGRRTAGTCMDVLGSGCVDALINQAQNLISDLTDRGGFQCSDLAQRLQNSPATVCTRTGTWGKITTNTIISPSLSPVSPGQSCNPTIDQSYDLYSVASFNQPGDAIVTPLMTIFAPTRNSSSVLTKAEVHMNCLQPVVDEPKNNPAVKSGGNTLAVKGWLPFATVAVTGVIATTFLLL